MRDVYFLPVAPAQVPRKYLTPSLSNADLYACKDDVARMAVKSMKESNLLISPNFSLKCASTSSTVMPPSVECPGTLTKCKPNPLPGGAPPPEGETSRVV